MYEINLSEIGRQLINLFVQKQMLNVSQIVTIHSTLYRINTTVQLKPSHCFMQYHQPIAGQNFCLFVLIVWMINELRNDTSTSENPIVRRSVELQFPTFILTILVSTSILCVVS